MELQASRTAARRGKDGEAVPVARPGPIFMGSCANRARNRLARLAEELGGGLGPYGLQAAIAACHARALSAEETDWDRIVLLYDALLETGPSSGRSPVVALNRAVAVGMAQGPAAGLEALDAAAALAGEAGLAGYHLFPSVRGDLLMKMGRCSEACGEIRRAHPNDQEPAGAGIVEEQDAATGEGSAFGLGAWGEADWVGLLWFAADV